MAVIEWVDNGETSSSFIGFHRHSCDINECHSHSSLGCCLISFLFVVGTATS